MAKKDVLKRLNTFLEGISKAQNEEKKQEKEANTLALTLASSADLAELLEKQNKKLEEIVSLLKDKNIVQ